MGYWQGLVSPLAGHLQVDAMDVVWKPDCAPVGYLRPVSSGAPGNRQANHEKT